MFSLQFLEPLIPARSMLETFLCTFPAKPCMSHSRREITLTVLPTPRNPFWKVNNSAILFELYKNLFFAQKQSFVRNLIQKNKFGFDKVNK